MQLEEADNPLSTSSDQLPDEVDEVNELNQTAIRMQVALMLAVNVHSITLQLNLPPPSPPPPSAPPPSPPLPSAPPAQR